MTMAVRHLETLEHEHFSVLTPSVPFSQCRGVMGERLRWTLEVST